MTPERAGRRLADCVYHCLLIDVEALKPGNVSHYAAGHDMEVDHFVESARLTTPLLCERDQRVGRRILNSVRLTMKDVGCNTNLGIVLLFAPLIFALQHKQRTETLRHALGSVIDRIDEQESADIFQAICLASPGGLGQSSQYDVHLLPEVTIKEAMRFSRDRDRIAFQYISQFEDIFERGIERIKASYSRWNSMEWAAVSCYLDFLSTWRDSHVQRKFGVEIAERVRRMAQPVTQRFAQCAQPESMVNALLELDQELKCEGINPGTTADLTVASVLAYRLVHEQII